MLMLSLENTVLEQAVAQELCSSVLNRSLSPPQHRLSVLNCLSAGRQLGVQHQLSRCFTCCPPDGICCWEDPEQTTDEKHAQHTVRKAVLIKKRFCHERVDFQKLQITV